MKCIVIRAKASNCMPIDLLGGLVLNPTNKCTVPARIGEEILKRWPMFYTKLDTVEVERLKNGNWEVEPYVTGTSKSAQSKKAKKAEKEAKSESLEIEGSADKSMAKKANVKAK